MLPFPPNLGLTARRLHENDAPVLQSLLDACVEFEVLIYGEPAGPNRAREELTELPPGRTLEDKFFFGLFTPRPRICGALDLVRGYRDPTDWYMGLLLLEPQARGQGLGEGVLRAAEAWVHSQGGRRIRLSCAEQNEAGRRFWERQGYRADRTFPPRRMGVRDTVLVELLRDLP